MSKTDNDIIEELNTCFFEGERQSVWCKEHDLPATLFELEKFLRTALSEARADERGKISTLAEESIEYPNGIADGAWVYLGKLKAIIRDLS
jgi:hypothetical protein